MLPAMVTIGGVITASQGERLPFSSRYCTSAHRKSRVRHQLFWVTGMSSIIGIGRFEYFRASFSLLTIGPGGLFAGIVLYVSSFYPRKRMQIRYA